MENLREQTKTGKRQRKSFRGLFLHGLLVTGLICGTAGFAFADDADEDHKVVFTADVNRREISEDDSVSLKITLKRSNASEAGELKYHAPDFELVNDYHEDLRIESTYDAKKDRFMARAMEQLTKVLKPLKRGELTISGISVLVDGKKLKAPDIVVTVGPSGSGTAPPRGYGGGGVWASRFRQENGERKLFLASRSRSIKSIQGPANYD